MTTRPPPASRPRRPASSGASLTRWLPALAAAVVLAVVLVAGLSGKSNGSARSADTADTQAAGSETSTSVASTDDPLGAVDAASLQAPAAADAAVAIAGAATVKTSLSSTIRKGSYGDDVKKVQQRLLDLGFAPGPADGQFGGGTQQAVWAFEKLVLATPRQQATGKVTDEMWQKMQDTITIPPRRPTGAGTTHLEIYMPQQVAIVFVDDVPKVIAHIATGVENPDRSPKKWCEIVTYDTDEKGALLPAPVKQDVCALAKTPGGVFRFTRSYEGNHVGPLGGMTNPWFFNYGVAIHGADNVPLEPASHGCVRVNQAIAKILPTLFHVRDLVYVWAEDGKDPEQYTKAETKPSFNYPNPDATTSTSSSTTTTAAPTTTTVKVATTVAATTPPTSAAPVTTVPKPTTVPVTTAAPPTTAGA